MGGVQSAMGAAYSILQLSIDICGYDVTLLQLFLFFSVAGTLLRLVYGIFE